MSSVASVQRVRVEKLICIGCHSCQTRQGDDNHTAVPCGRSETYATARASPRKLVLSAISRRLEKIRGNFLAEVLDKTGNKKLEDTWVVDPTMNR